MYDFVTLGEILIDCTPAPENEQGMPQFSCNPGGAPANVAAMVAKLGGASAFVGKVGADLFGDFFVPGAGGLRRRYKRYRASVISSTRRTDTPAKYISMRASSTLLSRRR